MRRDIYRGRYPRPEKNHNVVIVSGKMLIFLRQ